VTERLSNAMEPDAIDVLIRDLRVSSTLFCRSKFGAPWGFGVHAHGLAAFHIVTAGDCWLDIDGDPKRRHLRSGDLAILPRGDTHWLRDDPESPAMWLEDLLAKDPLDTDLRLRSGGRGAITDLVCGAFALDGGSQHPLLAALPPVIWVRGNRDRPLPWLAKTLELIRHEIHTPGAGGAALLERMSEVLLGQALRATLLEFEDGESLQLEALDDRGIAPAVRAIHERPGHAWSVGELANLSAMSRSAFAARFRSLTGDAPIRYVTRCRLVRASRQLRTTDAALAEIALAAGYESVFSFSRAFKRAFGVPPHAYRERAKADGFEARALSLPTPP
jgi:AraC-like DNA-binding protein/mannose-6-phosphate isomerase-like protein (cupin superfamily)